MCVCGWVGGGESERGPLAPGGTRDGRAWHHLVTSKVVQMFVPCTSANRCVFQKEARAMTAAGTTCLLVSRLARLVFYCRTTSVSTAPCKSRRMFCPTHRASYCAPCQPLLRAFSGWIRSPPPTMRDHVPGNYFTEMCSGSDANRCVFQKEARAMAEAGTTCLLDLSGSLKLSPSWLYSLL